MRRFLFGFFVALGLFAIPSAVSAESISSQVTLTGIVPEMRFIYVNQDGFIDKIVGNTSNNVTPRVVGADNRELPLTDAVSQQYSYFMDQHGWHLDAGVSYAVNPVQVNTDVSPLSIEINTQTQTSADSFRLQVGLTPTSLDG